MDRAAYQKRYRQEYKAHAKRVSLTLSARYGQDYARSIQGGFTTYLTYSGSDPETARFFEQVSGKVIEHTEAEEADAQSQHHEYNLLNADAVRRL